MKSRRSRSSPGPTRSRVDWSVLSWPADRFDVVADYADGWEGELNELLRKQGVFYEVNNQPDGLWAILISLLPWVFLLGFMIFIFMQMQGSGNRVMQFGKARARMVTKEQPKVTFNDVAGLTEAIEELQEIKGLPPEPRQVPGPRRQDPERCPPLRASRDGQDPSRQGGGR